MRLLFIAATLASLSTLALGQTPGNGNLFKRLNAGTTFTRVDADYIAYVTTGNKLSSIKGCTGALIDPKYVVIPQACLDTDSLTGTDADFNKMTVTIGHTNSNLKKTLTKYQVSKLYTSTQFAIDGVASDIALLRLSTAVKSSIAKPAMLYGGDFKASTPAMLVGFVTTGTASSNATIDKLRYENVKIQDDQYCLGANNLYDSSKNFCVRVKSGLNTCNGDLGAPILTPVDNDGSDSSTSTNTSSGTGTGSGKAVDTTSGTVAPKAKAYALLGLTYTTTTTGADTQTGCQLAGTTGYYAWVYPYIDQLAAIIESSFQNMTLTNSTASVTTDPYLHPGITFENGVANAASLSIAALLVWVVALAL